MFGKEREQAAEHRHQGKGTQSGGGIAASFPFHANEQTNTQGRGKGFNRRSEFGGKKAHGRAFAKGGKAGNEPENSVLR